MFAKSWLAPPALPALALTVLTAGCSTQPARQPRTVSAPPAPAPAAPREAQAAIAPANRLAALAATAINPRLAGAAMLGTRTIAGNVAAAPNLRALARAVSVSNAAQTLRAAGPVTVFAPSDEAFARLAPGAVEELLLPANRETLNKLLNYHVVPGTMTLEELRTRIDRGGGVARLSTVGGDLLMARREGKAVALTDTQGNKSYIETPDVQQTDGVFHVINGVMVPRLA